MLWTCKAKKRNLLGGDDEDDDDNNITIFSLGIGDALGIKK